MQIKKYQNTPGPLQRDTITIGELPEGYLFKYGNRTVVFPSGKRMTLREARKQYGPTHIKTSNLPGYNEFQPPYQEQNDNATAREVEKSAADRFVGSEYGTGNQLYNYLVKPIEGATPSRIWGAMTTDNASRFGDRFVYAWNPQNRGFFETNDYTRQAYDQDPVGGTILNLAGDVAVPTALVKGASAITSSRPVVTRKLASAINQSVRNAETPQELFPGQIGWAPRQTLTGYHASETPILKFDYNYPNWAVKTHNAPKGIYFTANETAPSGGFLAKRPYVQQVKTTLDKPMVQVGEVPAVGKNATRNQIEQMAMDRGADGIIYDGIADNQLKGQTIVKTLNPDVDVNIMTRTKTLTPEEYAGVPRSERNSPSPYQQIGTVTDSQKIDGHLQVEGERFGAYVGKGSEQTVFEDANDASRVLKVQTGQGFKNIDQIRLWHPQWFKRNQIGSIQVPMRFEGYLRGSNRIYPVYSQQRLKPLGSFVPMQFEKQVMPLIDLQFQRQGYNPNIRTNGLLHYGDIKPENMGFDSNGNLRFFDLDVYRKGGVIEVAK